MKKIDTEQKINFRTVVTNAIGTTRECNDGSSFGSFTISHNEVEGIADNLDTWWSEKYDDTTSTLKNAEEYFDEVYPEIEIA